MQIKGFGKANLLIAAIKKVPSKAKPCLPKLAGKEHFFSVSLKKRKLLVLISSIWAHRTIQLKIHEEVTGNKPKACAFTGVRSHTCTHSHTCLVLFPFFHDFRELYWLTIMFLRLTLVVTTTCQNLNPVFILKINVSHNGDSLCKQTHTRQAEEKREV